MFGWVTKNKHYLMEIIELQMIFISLFHVSFPVNDSAMLCECPD